MLSVAVQSSKSPCWCHRWSWKFPYWYNSPNYFWVCKHVHRKTVGIMYSSCTKQTTSLPHIQYPVLSTPFILELIDPMVPEYHLVAGISVNPHNYFSLYFKQIFSAAESETWRPQKVPQITLGWTSGDQGHSLEQCSWASTEGGLQSREIPDRCTQMQPTEEFETQGT